MNGASPSFCTKNDGSKMQHQYPELHHPSLEDLSNFYHMKSWGQREYRITYYFLSVEGKDVKQKPVPIQTRHRHSLLSMFHHQ